MEHKKDSSKTLYSCFESIFYNSYFPLFMLSNQIGVEKLYVEPTAKYEELGSSRFEIVEKLKNELCTIPKYSTYAVVGASGIGKTSSALFLTHQLWRLNSKSIIPIYIPLRQLESHAQRSNIPRTSAFDVLQTYLKMHENVFIMQNLDIQWICFEVKSNWQLILILDGYDEMQNQNFNLWETNGWNFDFTATVSTVVFSKNLQITNSKLRNNFKFHDTFSQCVIQPEIYEILEFDRSKVDLLIERTVRFLKTMDTIDSDNLQNYDDHWILTKTYTQNTAWETDATLYQTWFRTILPTLSQVAKTPFILVMIMQMLPGVVHENQLNIDDVGGEATNDVIRKICATELMIYTKFVESWFTFYQRKAEKDIDIIPIPGFGEKISHYYKAYANNLATFVLFKNHGFLDDGLVCEKDTEKWDHWVPRFDDPHCSDYGERQVENSNTSLLEFARMNDLFPTTNDESKISDKQMRNLRKLRSACLLKKINTLDEDNVMFKFLHTSIIEYFGSREIFGGLRSRLDQIIRNGTNHTDFSFNTHNITDPIFTGVMTFLIQTAREDVEFYKSLEQCVLLSAEINGIQRLASNAISVMNMAGMPLPTNLKNVQIPGANLTKCIAGNVDFSGADLSGAILTQGWAPLANFKGANMQGCLIGHGVPLRVFSNSRNLKSLITVANSYVACSYIDKTIWIYYMRHSRDKSGHQIEVPRRAGEPNEAIFYLAELNDCKIGIVRIGCQKYAVDSIRSIVQYGVNSIFIYCIRSNTLQEVAIAWDKVERWKNISITFEKAGIDDEVDVKEIHSTNNVDGYEFRDHFEHMLRLDSYALGESRYLLIVQTFTKCSLEVPRRKRSLFGKEKVENYTFRRTSCIPTLSNKLLILSTPCKLNIYTNRDLEKTQVDFNSCEGLTVSISMKFKTKMTTFLIDLLTLQWQNIYVPIPTFQYQLHCFTMFSPNGKFFVVHSSNPNIYSRESNTWANVSDNISGNEPNFTCCVDSDNRFLAFSRTNYIAVCSLRTGIVFQKISRLMIGTASFSFFTDKHQQLYVIYQNGSALESTQVVDNISNYSQSSLVSYDLIYVSHDGKKLVASYKNDDNGSDQYDLMQVFEIGTATVHTKREFKFEKYLSFLGQEFMGVYGDLLFVADYDDINIWKLSKNATSVASPDGLQTDKTFFLDKIKLIMCVKDDSIQFCEIEESCAQGLQLHDKLTIPVANHISLDNSMPYLDMNDPNLVYLVCLTPMAVLAVVDLQNEFIRPVQFQKDEDHVSDSTEICEKFRFDLILGDIGESLPGDNQSVIFIQRKSLQKRGPIPYDWSYNEKVIAVALPGRHVQILDMDFQTLFQFQGFYEIMGLRLLPIVNRESGLTASLACDLLIWNNSGQLTRLGDIWLSSISSESSNGSKWRIVSTQAPSESLCLTNADMNQCHKSTTDNDGVFNFFDCTGNPSTRPYRSYNELFKAVREDDRSIFELNEDHIDLQMNWSIFVVSREIQVESLPIPAVDSHVALIIEGMRNNRHFVVRAELIQNRWKKFEIKMESIDEKSAISAGQYISCGWEREPETVLKLINEIWDDKIKFEDEQLEYHTVYNNCCKYVSDKLGNIGIVIPTSEIFGRKIYLPWDLMRRKNKRIEGSHLCKIGLWFIVAFCQSLPRYNWRVLSFWMLTLIVAIVAFSENNFLNFVDYLMK